MLYSQNSNDIINELCRKSGCKLLDPSKFSGWESIAALAVNVAQLMSYIIGALAIIMFMYAAFLFLIGGEKGREKGTKVIVNSIIAVAIAVLSFSFVSYLLAILNNLQV